MDRRLYLVAAFCVVATGVVVAYLFIAVSGARTDASALVRYTVSVSGFRKTSIFFVYFFPKRKRGFSRGAAISGDASLSSQ